MNYVEIMFSLMKGRYKKIGEGSSREVFDIGNGFVVKVAKNEAGLMQNEAEYKISRYDKSGIFAPIVNKCRNNLMLIMEKADYIEDISLVWNYFGVQDKWDFYRHPSIRRLEKKYNLLLGDLNRPSSWGIINGRPMIIDYGFTRGVKEAYYDDNAR